MNADPSSTPDVVSAAIAAFDFEAAFRAANGLVEAGRAAADKIDTESLSLHLNTRGLLHLQLGRYAEALVDLGDARRMNPNLDQNNLPLGQLFKDHYESVFKPEMARLESGITADALRNIAIAYFETGFYANAASYLNIAISVADPSEVAGLYNMLSGAYLGSGLIIEALQASAKAIALDPETDHTNHGLALRQLEDIGQDPSPFLEDIPPVPPSDGASAGSQGEAAADIVGGDHAAALDTLDPLVEAAKTKLQGAGAGGAASEELAALLLARGRRHLNLHHFDEAVSDFLEARRHSVNLGHADLHLGQFFQAEFGRSLKPLFDKLHAQISAETYNEIGVLFFNKGFHANAAIYFQLAAALSEGLVRAESLNNLAGTYLESQHIIEALRASSRAIALNPLISKVNFNLASLHLKPARIDPNAMLKDRFATLKTIH
jgi:tetratricopeptide (TPR) repeat protein